MAMTKDEFFGQPLWTAHVTGWPDEAIRPAEPLHKPVVAPPGARLALWPADPADLRRIAPDGAATAFQTPTFSLVDSGNRTLWAPKRSWKADLEPEATASGWPG